MEMNVEEIKAMRIRRQPPSPSTDYDRSKKRKNLEYFNYLDSMINDARRTRELKSRIAVAEAAFNKTKTLLTSKVDFTSAFLKIKEGTSKVLC
jgi:hypothetical protein